MIKDRKIGKIAVPDMDEAISSSVYTYFISTPFALHETFLENYISIIAGDFSKEYLYDTKPR